MILNRFFRKIILSIKRAIGIPDIRPDETIDVNGVGDSYSGEYYVDPVSHKYDTNNYRQHFDLDREGTSDSDGKDTD